LKERGAGATNETLKIRRIAMDPKQMAEWAYSHACDRCRSGEKCELDACINAQEVALFLQRLERVDTVDFHGNPIDGWLIRDRH
jgi:hypothetical protein